jgi:hypothetical protein
VTGRDVLASYGASSISEISDASGGEPSLLRLLGRLRARRGPLQDQQKVPAQPGVYVLWLDDGAWHGLGISPGVGGLAYVGKGDPSLRARFHEEWLPETSGRSSPRRSIGALLALTGALPLRATRRRDRDPARGARYYAFADDGEQHLSKWLQDHALFACAVANPGIEGRLIAWTRPPLNLTKWKNPARESIQAARRVMRDEAAQGH